MIEHYQFGKLIGNGVSYTADLILSREQVVLNWRRQKGHQLCVADIAAAVEEFGPSIVVIGTGAWGRLKVLPETKRYFDHLNISLVMQRTGQAWKTFNSLAPRELPLVAFHLKC